MRKRHRLFALVLYAVTLLALTPPRTEAAQTTPSVRYPVIFVPGIGGTQLYNGSDLVWINSWRLIGSQLPIISLLHLNWLMPLRLASDGQTPYSTSYQIRTGDILRSGITDAYSGLLASLRDYGYVEGQDLRVYPFDWRMDPSRAVEGLGRLVDRTLAETGAPQVVLIGHSLGGLVSRDYLVRQGDGKVKALIALATPWLGAPLAYRALEYGWDMGLRLPGTRWSALAPADVRLLAQNYPSVYALAPGQDYFDWYTGGYITREGRALSYQESLESGIGAHNRRLAVQVSPYLSRLLDGQNHGAQQFILAGRGRQTSAGYAESRGALGLTEMQEWFVDGDEVVPLYSADLGFSKEQGRIRQYIGPVLSVAYVNQPHTLFAQSGEVQRVVALWLDVVNGRRAPGP